jgi:hypothetical protein
MLHLLTTLALAATLPLASAIGSARVSNKCNFAVTLWSVGQSTAGGFTLAANGGAYAETLTLDPVTGGRALKISTDPNGLYDGAAETIFAYSLQGTQVWYDLSDVFGDAFSGHHITEQSAQPGAGTIDWPNGTPPAGSQVKVASSDYDVTLTLCA